MNLIDVFWRKNQTAFRKVECKEMLLRRELEWNLWKSGRAAARGSCARRVRDAAVIRHKTPSLIRDSLDLAQEAAPTLPLRKRLPVSFIFCPSSYGLCTSVKSLFSQDSLPGEGPHSGPSLLWQPGLHLNPTFNLWNKIKFYFITKTSLGHTRVLSPT